MKRGEIWTVGGGPGYASKPRPALILQSDRLDGTNSVLTCGLTTYNAAELELRPPVRPVPENGLREPSEVMVDKIMAVPRARLGKRVGALTTEEMSRVEQALLLVLGFGD